MSALAQRRDAARARFEAAGLPTRRVEDWKYSDLRAALGDASLSEGAAAWSVGALPDGVEMFDLAQDNAPSWVMDNLGKRAGTVLDAASLAFATGGVALRVTRDVAASVELTFSGAGAVRALVVVEAHASLALFERHEGAAERNTGLEIVLRPNAALEHVRLAPFALDAVQVEEIGLNAARDARYRAHYASFGAKLARLELAATLAGEGGEIALSGVSVLGDGAHADITTRVTHAAGRTQSSQLFKKVAAGRSRAVYQGRVAVAKGANGADSRQTAKALLLDARAEADLKPELEILADDVKCAHGAAVGDLDADSLFYLRARGIPEAEARTLLMRAFLEDAMSDMRADLRAPVADAVNAALAEVAQ